MHAERTLREAFRHDAIFEAQEMTARLLVCAALAGSAAVAGRLFSASPAPIRSC